MPIHTSAIRAFLAKWETSQTEGYIPHTKRNFTGRNDLAACGEVIASSLFVSGWRPGLGWVCVAAFTYQFIFHPFIVWYCIIQALPQPPALDSVLWELTLGMLGLGGLRSIDKIKGK